MSFCPSCGASNADGVRFCGECGADTGQGETSALAGGVQVDRPVVGDISKALGGMDQRRAIVAGVVVLALIVAYLAFVKPLDASEYEDRAEEYSVDLYAAVDDMSGTLSDFVLTGIDNGYGSDDAISASDVEDLISAYDESRSAAEDAARKIHALRPPKEYKTADRRLNEWATYYSEGYWNQVDGVIKAAEYGTYAELLQSHLDLYGFTSRRAPAADRELNRAADDLGFSLSL